MLENIWNETIKTLKETLPSSKSMWLGFIEYKSSTEDSISLVAKSDMYINAFNDSCKADVQSLLDELSGRHIQITIEKGEVSKETASLNKQEKTESKPAAPKRKSTLNPIYTFDNFIPCEETNFAYNAAKAIAMNPGISYNPCLIYGGVGLGKTHLLESIGNYIEAESNNRKNVIYVTAETFTNDFIESLGNKTAPAFRIKYRKADVLLIDDIHFFSKKESTQEELFHTFNELYENQKQIVFTCDRPISELNDFTDRIKSRFQRGLNINLKAPDYETRVAILRKKCQEKQIRISDQVINYMAENIKTNVRDLEGALTTLVAYSKLVKSDITLEIAQEQLKNIVVAPIASEQDISISSIVKEVSSFYKVDVSDIKGKKRTAIIKDARNVAIYLTRKITQYSTTEIGTYFDRDHSTVTHSIDKVDKEKKTNAELSSSLDAMEANIRAKAR